jgi:hypothetical protein
LALHPSFFQKYTLKWHHAFVPCAQLIAFHPRFGCILRFTPCAQLLWNLPLIYKVVSRVRLAKVKCLCPWLTWNCDWWTLANVSSDFTNWTILYWIEPGINFLLLLYCVSLNHIHHVGLKFINAKTPSFVEPNN